MDWVTMFGLAGVNWIAAAGSACLGFVAGAIAGCFFGEAKKLD